MSWNRRRPNSLRSAARRVPASRLRDAGIQIAADDYGTGYSPLTRITDLPISIIKIDQRFVRRALSDPRARAVVTSLHDLAKEIGIAAIAKGVEEAASAEMLRATVFVTPRGSCGSQPSRPNASSPCSSTHSPPQQQPAVESIWLLLGENRKLVPELDGVTAELATPPR